MFLKELRKEKNLTQEQLAEKLSVTGRTVSRWETGVNLPDLSLLVELADFYDVDIREIIDGERKSEIMDNETKETLLKVSDYAAADKKRTVKKTRRRVTIIWIVCIVSAVLILLVLNFICGNPVSAALAKNNAQTVADLRFGKGEYLADAVGYWIEDAEYFVTMRKPDCPDAKFSMNFGSFGNYRYDTYDSDVQRRGNVFLRINADYTALAQDAVRAVFTEDPHNYCFGEILTGDDAAAIGEKGLLPEEIALGQIFDYASLGKQSGRIVLLLDDGVLDTAVSPGNGDIAMLSAENLAEIMLRVKAAMDAHNVTFRLISVSITDRSSAGDGTGYASVGVWDFPYDQINAEGLAERIAEAME